MSKSNEHYDEASRTRSSAGVVIVVVILIVLLPLFYVLSIGPVIWLEANNYIEVGENSPIVLFYWPILWSAERFAFAEAALEWYAELWDG